MPLTSRTLKGSRPQAIEGLGLLHMGSLASFQSYTTYGGPCRSDRPIVNVLEPPLPSTEQELPIGVLGNKNIT